MLKLSLLVKIRLAINGGATTSIQGLILPGHAKDPYNKYTLALPPQILDLLMHSRGVQLYPMQGIEE